MTKKYSKNFITQQSAKLFYYKGYKNTELTDIFKACDMPNDIFYKYFSSKEELLITVIKYHTENLINFFNNNVDDLSISKFHYFFEKYFENIVNNKFHGGSPLGNLALELSDINKNIREELVKSYKKIELRFSFFITTLKYAFPEKYDDIVPETTARILIALLEGTILMLKTEKESSAINDFFVFFDIIFKLNEDTLSESEKTNNAVKEKVVKAQETDISDSAQNEVIQEEPDEIENKNENLKIEEEEIAKVEESHNDDNMYYDIDSDSLINVFNNLENYQKNENEK
ncbi:TetR/AcrR family transcriptional regulator [Leptotrichia buccalis]|uniref:Transcriptional regulator, TetR family n=1 Tax=Leptotrichia buccalis (strain ATCC 14201 / DSM 1135 / JCM 12969 / NCTC 10249 / C-1013-b) TaxID=523794 RepID=C7NDA5_LEPBD|nr:TetR/AcrR family transcriptional regulator [Leptotrichia buccalis]ACV39983.1 transcriptional regulator, TetR family [Leptotrichia buccalis C-1013-b]